jgi:hypothetical protein
MISSRTSLPKPFVRKNRASTRCEHVGRLSHHRSVDFATHHCQRNQGAKVRLRRRAPDACRPAPSARGYIAVLQLFGDKQTEPINSELDWLERGELSRRLAEQRCSHWRTLWRASRGTRNFENRNFCSNPGTSATQSCYFGNCRFLKEFGSTKKRRQSFTSK